jgi:hypothetical protein
MSWRIGLGSALIAGVIMLLPYGFAGQARAQGNAALEQRMSAELSQLQQQLQQLRSENEAHRTKVSQKGVKIPATIMQLRAAQTDLEHSIPILERLPNHYEGQKEAAAKDITAALVDIERCKEIDWKIAETGHP